MSVQEKNILIWEYAEKPDYRLGIDDVYQLYNRGPHDKDTLVESAMFVKKLLPAMLAKRVKDLQVACLSKTGPCTANIRQCQGKR